MTPAEVKAKFIADGKSVSDWATKNGHPPDAVYRVLNGFTPCKRGRMHQIAVQLGLKPDTAKASAAI